MRRSRAIIFLILIGLGIIVFAVVRGIRSEPEFEQVVLCPGPDSYGYSCETTRELEYIDATHDTQLFGDDVVAVIDLPFSFSFYGQSYTAISVSSNGNIQFNQSNSGFENECLFPKPAVDFGELIAPYWDDLDLTLYGFIETEVVGEDPNRTFVIEWEDAPSFDNPDDTVTFEIQLIESSNNIAFLYKDVDRIDGDRGSSATIGIQSEQAGYALQFGCNQHVLINNMQLQFERPADGQEEVLQSDIGDLEFVQEWMLKGEVDLVLSTLNEKGPEELKELRNYWRSQRPQRNIQWLFTADENNNEEELIFFRFGPNGYPERLEASIFYRTRGDAWNYLTKLYPFARQVGLGKITIVAQDDLTGDGLGDILLQNDLDGRLMVLSRAEAIWQIYPAPLRCLGNTAIIDQDNDGVGEIIRDGCPNQGRLLTRWSDDEFVTDQLK